MQKSSGFFNGGLLMKERLQNVMGRIASATPESPIAVTCTRGGFRSFFAATAYAPKAIEQEQEKDKMVGVFDQTMDPDKVRRQLYDALIKARK